MGLLYGRAGRLTAFFGVVSGPGRIGLAFVFGGLMKNHFELAVFLATPDPGPFVPGLDILV